MRESDVAGLLSSLVTHHSSLREGGVVDWQWMLWIVGGAATLFVVGCLLLHCYLVHKYLWVVLRIFQEKPIFVIPHGQPQPDAEDLTIPSVDGIPLKACYLKTKVARKGVICFGLEFGSNRWSSVPYCEFLLEAGYDVFACETRGQGKTPAPEGYEPLQWVTEFEVLDLRSAYEYLRNRPDAAPRGFGLFGLSKGGSAGLLEAAGDESVRCFVTDGIFGTLTTMVPYMRQFVMIYTTRRWLINMLPDAYLRFLAKLALRKIEVERKVKYPSLVRAMRCLGSRPLLMIHGGGDTYIKPDMARSLFDIVAGPKELWIVDKAKHNQAFHAANEEYKRRILEFFDKNLK